MSARWLAAARARRRSGWRGSSGAARRDARGWLTAVRDPRSAAHGVLWDLALADVAALDRYEGVPQGLYAKLMQAVIAERGPKQAIVYFGANAGPGAPRADYMADVLAAARHGRCRRRGSRRWRG